MRAAVAGDPDTLRAVADAMKAAAADPSAAWAVFRCDVHGRSALRPGDNPRRRIAGLPGQDLSFEAQAGLSESSSQSFDFGVICMGFVDRPHLLERWGRPTIPRPPQISPYQF